ARGAAAADGERGQWRSRTEARAQQASDRRCARGAACQWCAHRRRAHPRAQARGHLRGDDEGPQGGESVIEVNYGGLRTLTLKEIKRFWSVLGQTVTAPVVTALLYLLVFGQVMQGRVEVYPGVSYTQFLIPGLIMMSVIQNAFANSSSSLIQSKLLGNLVFILMAPISAWEL